MKLRYCMTSAKRNKTSNVPVDPFIAVYLLDFGEVLLIRLK